MPFRTQIFFCDYGSSEPRIFGPTESIQNEVDSASTDETRCGDGQVVLAGDYLSNAIEAIDRQTGRQVWRFEGEPGFVGFPEAPLVAGTNVFIGSGDTYMYAKNLLTRHLIWRTKMLASIENYTLYGTELLVNYHGLATLNLQTGHLDQALLPGRNEFVTSDFRDH